MTSPLDAAKPVADALLYEGYLLYPYRTSSGKNQSRCRWQFGVLAPPSYVAADTGEHASSRTEVLIDPRADPELLIRVRFLQFQSRTVESGAEDTGYTEVDELVADGTTLRPWDEAVDREVDVRVRVAELATGARNVPVRASGEIVHEAVTGGRLVRSTWPVRANLALSSEELPGPYGVLRVRAELTNESTWDARDAPREEALRHSLIAAHLVLSVSGGQFISLLEPPEWARPYVDGCTNERIWPVLVGEPGRTDLMLSSPIILYDYPVIAPESPGDFFDATEMDEMLALRTLTLTDEEKREARATDPKAAEIIDRADHLPPELLDRLHGAIRYLRPAGDTGTPAEPTSIEELTTLDVPWWDPGADASVSPETDSVIIDGVPVAKGSRVVLRPGLRRADAQDMFLHGRVATVQAVLLDVDGERHLAVALEDDPGADLQVAHGRFRYFAPEELTPLVTEPGTEEATGILVAGIGNIFLGDDGFGAEVARALEDAELPDGVQVADYGVSGMHLAYDLAGGYAATILIDATERGEAPGTLYEIEIDPASVGADPEDQLGAGRFVDAHGMHPESVLGLLRMLGGQTGRVLLVGCEPGSVEPGIGLSEAVAAAVGPAVEVVRRLAAELGTPTPEQSTPDGSGQDPASVPLDMTAIGVRATDTKDT